MRLSFIVALGCGSVVLASAAYFGSSFTSGTSTTAPGSTAAAPRHEPALYNTTAAGWTLRLDPDAGETMPGPSSRLQPASKSSSAAELQPVFHDDGSVSFSLNASHMTSQYVQISCDGKLRVTHTPALDGAAPACDKALEATR